MSERGAAFNVLRSSFAVFASSPHAAGVGALANPGRLAGASCCTGMRGCVPAAPSPFPVEERRCGLVELWAGCMHCHDPIGGVNWRL